MPRVTLGVGFASQPSPWIFPLVVEPEVVFPGPSITSAEELAAMEQMSGQVDPFYLFARYLEWEETEEPTAAWDLLAAARSSHADTRAHARSLLANSRTLGGAGVDAILERNPKTKRCSAVETDMNMPYGLDVIENCTACGYARPHFFCNLPLAALEALNVISHKSTLPAGAILFVEGQEPRGMFILCSGKVHLSTSSREGKTLLLKTVEAGEALGLSAAISGTGYEATAETATPCHVNFVDRKNLLELMQAHSEMGVQAAGCLSRQFHSAYRDIHDLVLSRSSAGKLARLLLSQSTAGSEDSEARVVLPMTHEEMAQRIGASRETVTRLLSALKRKKLIGLDGPTLIIHDHLGLETLAG